MLSVPGIPVNPEMVIADTSALVQLFVADSIAPLKQLKSHYGIQVVVTEAVKSELLYIPTKVFPNGRGRRFAGLDGPIRKAFRDGVLVGIDPDFLATRFGQNFTMVYQQAEQRGQLLSTYVDRGEAYTQAYAESLGIDSTITNDTRSIAQFASQKIGTPRPVIRSFDVITFAFQINLFNEAACDSARQLLTKSDETVDPAFRNCSFKSGITKFYPRLLDNSRSPVGADICPDRSSDRLWITPL